MDYHIDKECSALGGLFQTIINDMKTQAPIWEDFVNKASKLHSTLRTTIVAIGTFLEAFQRVADMATNTRGATREIGSALTRLCMRHRSIEQKLKVFTSSILDLCVNPLQERMEEWKKNVLQLDKDHAKEYKRARNEIKKASSDTMRLQKKVRKGSYILGKNDMQNKLDSAMQEVNDKFLLLEETEKNAVRTALIEERNRFCLFISCLKPVVDEEIAMLGEITHLQEVCDALCMQAGDPYSLPPASEQVIIDIKTADNHQFAFHVHKTPPSSPSSLGSRKSSMCSISSIASSSSGSTQSHSPSHHLRQRAVSQPPVAGTLRLSSVSSQDSGFTSQDTLFQKNQAQLLYKAELEPKKSMTEAGSAGETDSNSSTPSPSHYAGPPQTSASTWSNWPDPPNPQPRPDPANLELPFDRPHTISTAYERHARPALTAQTFEPLDGTTPTPQADPKPVSSTAPSTPSPYAVPVTMMDIARNGQASVKYATPVIISRPSASPYAVPCIVPPPRPSEYTAHKPPAPPPGPKPRIKAVSPPMVPDFNSAQSDQSKKKNVYMTAGILTAGGPLPVYVNMNELANMAVAKHKEAEESRRGSMKVLEEGKMAAADPDTAIYARPTIARCQRSTSVPAAQDKHPMSKVIEEVTLRSVTLRKRSPHRASSPQRQISSPAGGCSETKDQEKQALADAIKELDASTAALQMVYEGGGNNTQPAAGSRHSVAGYGINLTGADLNSESSTDSGVPPPGGGSATLRRGSLPNKPPTPVRRTSSISSGMVNLQQPPQPVTTAAQPGQQNDGGRSGSSTPTPPDTQHRRSTSAVSQHDRPPDTLRHVYTAPCLAPEEGNIEDGWLPPPPAEFMEPAVEEPLYDSPSSNSSTPTSRTSRGSVSDTHANIMHSLNAVFRQTSAPAPTPGPQAWHPDSLPLRSISLPHHTRSLSQSSDDITPTAENPSPDNSFLTQIKRGVSLRRAQSDDRSAPRLPQVPR